VAMAHAAALLIWSSVAESQSLGYLPSHPRPPEFLSTPPESLRRDIGSRSTYPLVDVELLLRNEPEQLGKRSAFFEQAPSLTAWVTSPTNSRTV